MEADHDSDGKIRAKMALPMESFSPGYMGERQQEADVRYVELLLHVMKEIRSLGFRVIVVMAGHYPLLAHARAAVELFNLQSRDEATAWACTGYELVRNELPNAGDHAAAWETSLMLALRPELVDLSRLPSNPSTPLVGVRGQDPRRYASKEYGEQGIAACVGAINTKIAELLRRFDSSA